MCVLRCQVQLLCVHVCTEVPGTAVMVPGMHSSPQPILFKQFFRQLVSDGVTLMHTASCVFKMAGLLMMCQYDGL